MRLIKYLFALVLLVAIVAGVYVWRMPAEVGYRYGARFLGPLALTGVRGTIWDGHADGVNLFGQDLGELDWHARKQPLLAREFVADVRMKASQRAAIASTYVREPPRTTRHGGRPVSCSMWWLAMNWIRYFAGNSRIPAAGEDHSALAIGTRCWSRNAAPWPRSRR